MFSSGEHVFYFLLLAVRIRIDISGYFPIGNIILHSFIGAVVIPVLCIPIHEFLHIVPYFFFGARRIRIGMDLKQYLFYVTAHKHVLKAWQFIIVALTPFLLISIFSIILILRLPGLWKWSLSLFLFFHSTMCAGDFALINFYYLNRSKKILTWDDADKKEAYFYEKI